MVRVDAEPWAAHHKYLNRLLFWMIAKAEPGLVVSLLHRPHEDDRSYLLSFYCVWMRDADRFHLSDQNELVCSISEGGNGEDQSIVRETVFDDFVRGRYTVEERMLRPAAECRAFDVECRTPSAEDVLPRPVRIKLPRTSLRVMRILEHEIQGCEECRSLDDYDVLIVLAICEHRIDFKSTERPTNASFHFSSEDWSIDMLWHVDDLRGSD